MSPAAVAGGLSDEERRGGGGGEAGWGKRRWGSRWLRIKKVENEAAEGRGEGGGGKPRREEDKNEALALPVLPCVPWSG